MGRADRAPSKEAALELYRERNACWYRTCRSLWQEWSAVGWSDRLRNVKVSILTDLDVFQVKVVC